MSATPQANVTEDDDDIDAALSDLQVSVLAAVMTNIESNTCNDVDCISLE